MIVNKRNTDQQSYLFEKLCDDIAGQSEYLKYVFSRNFEKKDLQNILRMFLCLVMGLCSIMELGTTNGLFYTVENNMLLSYYSYIYAREKGSIPEDYISHMKIVNKQMNDYM